MGKKGVADRYARGIRTSIRDNAAAFGYSAMITVSLAAMAAMEGTPQVGELFLFVLGAGLAFAAVEAAVSGLFTKRIRGEPSEVVVLGSALGILSMSAGLGAAVGIGRLSEGWVPWVAGPFAATVAYLLVVGLEMSLAERAEENIQRDKRKQR